MILAKCCRAATDQGAATSISSPAARADVAPSAGHRGAAGARAAAHKNRAHPDGLHAGLQDALARPVAGQMSDYVETIVAGDNETRLVVRGEKVTLLAGGRLTPYRL